VFNRVGIIFCGGLLLLAGCASRPTPPPPGIVRETNTVGSSPLNWTNPAAKWLRVPAPLPLTVKPLPSAAAPPEPPAESWTPLARWAAGRGLAAPHRVTGLPAVEYAIGSSNGVLNLTVGSREAAWNGVQFYLGFAPELIDGEIALRGLDLQKNLEPLLCGPPLAFGPRRVVVIDPGHGGHNTGTRSVLDGRWEKEFTLDWAQRLAPLLTREGWTVFLTRTNDTDLSLADRVAFAAAHHASLFLSLHFNATADHNERASGLETYCLTPTGMPSVLTRGYADPLFEVLPNNTFDAQNLQLALRVQTALLRATGLDDLGVQRARFPGVLRGQTCPAILIEAGFLSSPHDARLIESPEFRQKLAEALANALK